MGGREGTKRSRGERARLVGEEKRKTERKKERKKERRERGTVGNREVNREERRRKKRGERKGAETRRAVDDRPPRKTGERE